MIAIIGAMQEEIDQLAADMTLARTVKSGMDRLLIGTLYGQKAALAVCGPGKVNAALCAQAMIVHCAPDWVLNIGVAGSATPEVGIGDMVIATAAVQHDIDYGSIGDAKGMVSRLNLVELPCDGELRQRLRHAAEAVPGMKVHEGLIATGDQFVDQAETRQRIRAYFPCLAIEMEGGAVAQACALHGVPCGIVRSISDNASAQSDIDYWSFKKLAAAHSQAVVKQLLREMSA